MESNRNDSLSWERLAESPGFRIVHILFIVTSTTTGVLGAIMFNDGLAIIPSMTGVLISAATVWYMIKGWQEHKYTGPALRVSVILYSVAMFDEWGNMMAKGVGGSFAEAYFGWFIASSIVIILALWVRLELFSEDYADMREAKAMQSREVSAKRKLLNYQRLSRIAMQEEELLKQDLARRGRKMAMRALYAATVKRLQGWDTRRKIAAGARGQVRELLLTTGIVEDERGQRQNRVDWRLSVAEPSGDGAASFR